MPAILYFVIVRYIRIAAVIVGVVITAKLNARQRSEHPPGQ